MTFAKCPKSKTGWLIFVRLLYFIIYFFLCQLHQIQQIYFLGRHIGKLSTIMNSGLQSPPDFASQRSDAIQTEQNVSISVTTTEDDPPPNAPFALLKAFEFSSLNKVLIIAINIFKFLKTILSFLAV